MRIVLSKMLKFALLTWTSSISFTCKDRDSGSDVKVINGTDIDDAIYPEVVSLKGCTGTFIGLNAIITAAHCVEREILGTSPKSYQFIEQTFGDHVPAKTVYYPAPLKGRHMDQAVLIFQEDLAPKVAKISKIVPTKGVQVTIVGFGCNDFKTRSGAGQKRMGTNQLKSGFSEVSLFDSPGAHVCPGDSGGPIFVANRLVATVSSASVSLSILVGLFHQQSRDLLQHAVFEGAKIEGISGKDLSKEIRTVTKSH